MTDEQAFTAVLIQRDLYHDIADELAERIAKITGVEIGEHSSDNDPWMRAKYAADEYLATPASAGVEEFPLPDIASQIVNETCWVLVEALPEALSGHNWNNLKPALYKALKHFHASIGLQARTEGEADRGIVDSRCNYLALKDSICNKCGREHDGVLAVVNFPGTDGSGT